MARINPTAITLACAFLLSSACSQAAGQKPAPAAPDAQASPTGKPAAKKPAVIQAIEAQGFEVIGEFDAPAGLRGYAGLVGQRPVAVYATADGKHAVVGDLINVRGEDIGVATLERLVSGPISARTWVQLEASQWIVDGKANAPRVIYTFSDPNCPYCNKFWSAARPWVDSGKVQLRHVMVGVIRPDSANKVAAMMTSTSPSEAHHRNETSYASGGIKPAASVTAKVRAALDANEKLMVDLGFQGTPGILFRDDKGMVQRRSGLPAADDLEVVLGPR